MTGGDAGGSRLTTIRLGDSIIAGNSDGNHFPEHVSSLQTEASPFIDEEGSNICRLNVDSLSSETSSPFAYLIIKGKSICMSEVYKMVLERLTTSSNDAGTSALTLDREKNKVNRIKIFAYEKFYLDKHVEFSGINLVICSPNWKVCENAVISLSGRNGANHEQTQNSNSTSSPPPYNGDHGCPGHPGFPSGSAFLAGINEGQVLEVNANGGSGSKGQDGGAGMDAPRILDFSGEQRRLKNDCWDTVPAIVPLTARSSHWLILDHNGPLLRKIKPPFYPDCEVYHLKREVRGAGFVAFHFSLNDQQFYYTCNLSKKVEIFRIHLDATSVSKSKFEVIHTLEYVDTLVSAFPFKLNSLVFFFTFFDTGDYVIEEFEFSNKSNTFVITERKSRTPLFVGLEYIHPFSIQDVQYFYAGTSQKWWIYSISAEFDVSFCSEGDSSHSQVLQFSPLCKNSVEQLICLQDSNKEWFILSLCLSSPSSFTVKCQKQSTYSHMFGCTFFDSDSAHYLSFHLSPITTKGCWNPLKSSSSLSNGHWIVSNVGFHYEGGKSGAPGAGGRGAVEGEVYHCHSSIEVSRTSGADGVKGTPGSSGLSGWATIPLNVNTGTTQGNPMEPDVPIRLYPWDIISQLYSEYHPLKETCSSLSPTFPKEFIDMLSTNADFFRPKENEEEADLRLIILTLFADEFEYRDETFSSSCWKSFTKALQDLENSNNSFFGGNEASLFVPGQLVLQAILSYRADSHLFIPNIEDYVKRLQSKCVEVREHRQIYDKYKLNKEFEQSLKARIKNSKENCATLLSDLEATLQSVADEFKSVLKKLQSTEKLLIDKLEELDENFKELRRLAIILPLCFALKLAFKAVSFCNPLVGGIGENIMDLVGAGFERSFSFRPIEEEFAVLPQVEEEVEEVVATSSSQERKSFVRKISSLMTNISQCFEVFRSLKEKNETLREREATLTQKLDLTYGSMMALVEYANNFSISSGIEVDRSYSYAELVDKQVKFFLKLEKYFNKLDEFLGDGVRKTKIKNTLKEVVTQFSGFIEIEKIILGDCKDLDRINTELSITGTTTAVKCIERYMSVGCMIQAHEKIVFHMLSHLFLAGGIKPTVDDIFSRSKVVELFRKENPDKLYSEYSYLLERMVKEWECLLRTISNDYTCAHTIRVMVVERTLFLPLKDADGTCQELITRCILRGGQTIAYVFRDHQYNYDFFSFKTFRLCIKHEDERIEKGLAWLLQYFDVTLIREGPNKFYSGDEYISCKLPYNLCKVHSFEEQSVNRILDNSEKGKKFSIMSPFGGFWKIELRNISPVPTVECVHDGQCFRSILSPCLLKKLERLCRRQISEKKILDGMNVGLEFFGSVFDYTQLDEKERTHQRSRDVSYFKEIFREHIINGNEARSAHAIN